MVSGGFAAAIRDIGSFAYRDAPRKPRDLTGQQFERLVADLYRGLGYHVEANVVLGGQQIDLLARRDVEGAPLIKLGVECKELSRPVSNQMVQDFVSSTIALREMRAVTAGTMVSKSGFTAQAKEVARRNEYVTLLSWQELSAKLFSVNQQLEQLVAEYESSDVFHTYVPAEIESLKWASLSAPGQTSETLESVLDRWRSHRRESDDISTLFILADFGAGKTTLLRRIQYEQAKAHLTGEDARVPLFVPLREYRDARDIETLLRAGFRDSYFRDLSAGLLWQAIKDGRFYVLLDGFDEMVDRSDAARRAELLTDLLTVLQTPCPTILTSRPSYFVERGELESAIASLRQEEYAFSAQSVKGQQSELLRAAQIRRKLVERNREARPGVALDRPISGRTAQVIRLRPLSRGMIEAFLARRSADLDRAGTSASALIDFLDRTYDLSDLATRPLLLKLIVDSVLEGAIDFDDTSAEFGPSGLYEIYTRAKLDLELAKGRVRRGGLSLETRRRLAEGLAVVMYESAELEVDFRTTMASLRASDESVGSALEDTSLTEEEVATDFATCSFVTLDNRGACRFIHKSFRGFFVARVLKDFLRRGHRLFDQELDREVLYFLGGFAPTSERLADELWTAFERAPKGARRRNLLAASLYTRPEHNARRIENASLTDVEYGQLRFQGGRATNVRWGDCEVNDLTLDGAKWNRVVLAECHVGHWTCSASEVDARLDGTSVGQLTTKRGRASFVLSAADVETWESGSSRISVELDNASRIGDIDVKGGLAQLRGGSSAGLVERVTVEDGCVMTLDARVENLEAQGAILSCVVRRGGRLTIGPKSSWRLQASALVIKADAETEPPSPRISWPFGKDQLKVDPECVLLATSAPMVRTAIERLVCGVFGPAGPAAWSPSSPAPAGWGVVRIGSTAHEEQLPEAAAGFIRGNVLFARKAWYEREVSAEGRLAGVHLLELIANGERQLADDLNGPETYEELVALAQKQFSAVRSDTWEPWPKRSRAADVLAPNAKGGHVAPS